MAEKKGEWIERSRLAIISQITDFVRRGIWERRLKDLPPMLAFLTRYLRVFFLAVRGFLEKDDQRSASVLTYQSLLTLVPVVAVMFGIAKGFGLEKLIEGQILQLAERGNWQSEVTNQITTFSHSLLDQTKGGLIAGVGVILLFWTVISILGKIEETFNGIWEIRQSRTLIRKFSDYLAIMVFTPVSVVISSSLTVMVGSRLRDTVHRFALLGALGPVILPLLNLLPYVSIWVLLTMLYLIMPNTRVPWRSAILGGVVAGTLYQLIQWVYIRFQIGVASYGAIYGSLSALPLFLAWLQLSWMVVLFGSEIAYASENYETFGFHPDYSRIGLASRRVLILRLFHLLVNRFYRAEGSYSLRQIAETLEVPLRLVKQLLRELIHAGLVVQTLTGVGNEIAFQPGRAIEGMTIKTALDAYEQSGKISIPENQSEEGKRISAFLDDLSEVVKGAPGNVLLKEI